MCFRPSAVDGAKKNGVQYGDCPTCGMPVVTNAEVTSGNCPYCGSAIPAESNENVSNTNHNVRIL